VYDVSVFYEPGIATDQFLSLFAGIILISILLFVIFFLFLRRRRKPETFGLTEDEQKFLGALSKENKVSQKKIARDINLSKAQTSRIAASLEKRGLIERIRRGRNYEVSLK
jgi:uncharacterized membrane protein